MNTLPHANLFFLISTIGFIVIFLLVAIGLVYLIRLLKSILRVSLKIEKDIDTIGDTAKEFIMQLSDSVIFSWIFGKRKRGILKK